MGCILESSDGQIMKACSNVSKSSKKKSNVLSGFLLQSRDALCLLHSVIGLVLLALFCVVN